jgi:L-ascorbate metabolism protein UlaG (beta-lactamase superfamily)
MNINFKWIGGATWILNINNIKIACDPVLSDAGSIIDFKIFQTTRLIKPYFDQHDFDNINYWLLTHYHEDHLDDTGIKVLSKNSSIICDRITKLVLRKNGIKNTKPMRWKDIIEFNPSEDEKIKIECIPAIHSRFKFLKKKIFNGNGYNVVYQKGDDNFSIYVTGDTLLKKELINNVKDAGYDLIIGNIGSAKIEKGILGAFIGRLTMNANDLKKLKTITKSKRAIAVHHGTFSHYSEIIDQKKKNSYEDIIFVNPGETIQIT